MSDEQRMDFSLPHGSLSGSATVARIAVLGRTVGYKNVPLTTGPVQCYAGWEYRVSYDPETGIATCELLIVDPSDAV